MEAFAPFEFRPVIAVAVSGGPDSLALLLLADRWARGRGGTAVALTVDHGLRAESAAEAAQVSAWAGSRGIAHEVLPWTGDKPRSGIQAAARQARYRLLSEACAERCILNLAFAHHADDQAETVLFRKERGSGPAGLAGMTASRSLGPVRMIRPLLGWPKSALVETCRALGQDYFEDPSNRSDRFARTGLRRRLAGDAGLRSSALEEASAQAFRRIDDENCLALALGRTAEIRPDGVVFLDPDAFLAVASETRQAVLAAAVRTVGGSEFGAGADAVRRLDQALAGADFAGASLGGCVIRRWRGRIFVCREPKRAAAPLRIGDGKWHRWDGRFLARMAEAKGVVTVGALGFGTYAKLRRSLDGMLPAVAGAGLPAVSVDDRVVAVPPIGWPEGGFAGAELRYSPLWPLSPETFTVVSAAPDIMSDGLGVLAATQ